MSLQYGTTEYPNTFKRQADFALDKSSRYSTLAEAIAYAKNNPIAYINQIIGVDETGGLYVLQTSEKNNTRFDLIPLESLFINYIKYEIGNWALTTRIEGVTAAFNFDIKYPVEATHYVVYINDEDVSGRLALGETFVTAPIMFNQEGAKITVALEKVDSDNIVTTLIKANAVTIHNNDYVTMGLLTTFEI